MVQTTKLFSLLVIIGLIGFCQIVYSQESAANTTTGGTTSTQAPTTPEGTTSTQAPTTTGGTTSTQAPTTTGGTTSTQAPTTTGGTTSTQAPTTTGGTTSTQAPTTTGGTSSTQAPTTTGGTSTDTPSSTEVTSSTEAPSPTTEEPTTTLPPPVHPEKAFPHNIGRFRSLNNKTCIILDGAFEILLSVPLDNSTSNETLVVPELAYAEEECTDKSQELTIYWPVPSKRNSTASFLNKIVLKFEKTKADEESDLAAEKRSFFLTQISVSFPPDQFDGYGGKFDHLITYIAGNLSNYETPLNSSYACNHEESIVGRANDGKEFQFQLKVANLKLEAYKDQTGKDEFSPQINCKADNKHPSRKGLIVGLSITVVLLVLGGAIGYYLWRRRQHAGYQRMDN